MIFDNVGWGLPKKLMGFYNPFYPELFSEAEIVGFS